MAAPNIYPNGIGGSSGAALATSAPLYTTGNVWYVSSANGVDAGSPAGLDREKPLATLAQAATNAAAGDIIVCLAKHSEQYAGTVTLSKAGLVIVGEGTGTSRPQFIRNGAGIMFTLSAQTTFYGIYFPGSITQSNQARFNVTASGCVFRECLFEFNTLDVAAAIGGTPTVAQIRDCQFNSTVTTTAFQPGVALNTNAVTDTSLENVTFDGAGSGWSNQNVWQSTGGHTRLRALNVDLLNGSQWALPTSSTGYIALRNKSGSAEVIWTP